ncbi:MAG: hypothetical protein HEP69_07895 [Aestuariivita sp.]|nr:hypothetical protein [Aestuariivita sp.]
MRGQDGDADQIIAQYVVAADGGRSPIRESPGIEMTGSTDAQDRIVIDTSNDPNRAQHTRFICSEKRLHVSVPAPDGGRRCEFMLLPGETHEEMLDFDVVQRLLRPYREITQDDIIRTTIYTFHARIADQFRIGVSSWQVTSHI